MENSLELKITRLHRLDGESNVKAFVDLAVYGSYSSGGQSYVGPRDWSLDFSWDVADLIWSTDQTTIDSRSRLTVQLRQDVLDQVTNLYFERRKLKAELLLSPPKNNREELYKSLEIQEVTASIDALTNGYLSELLQQE